MIRYAIAPLLVAMALAAAPAHGEILVTIPGIQGDSTIVGHEHEIVALSVQVGGGQIVPKSGPKLCAAPSSKTQLSAISLSKLTDKASPQLMMAAAQGTLFPQVTIEVGTITTQGFQTLDQYQLSGTFIGSYNASSSGGPPSSENLSLVFKTLQFTHFDPAGGSAGSATWSTCGG